MTDGVVGFLAAKNLPEFLASIKMQVVEAVSIGTALRLRLRMIPWRSVKNAKYQAIV